MRRRDLLATLAIGTMFVACGGRPRPADLPAPVSNATIGVGDVFEMRIVREDNLPTAFTVAPDGTVDLPYIKRLKVAGLEPQQIAEAVRKRLVDDEILTDPIVSVSVKEYNSKRVEVLGEVQRAGSLRFEPGMTLLRAISLAGGFNQMAARDKVTIRRQVGDKTRAAIVSVEDIIDNAIPDVPLQAGDSINIPQRVW
ncbi:polysaccharide biosynthesis/export family protein [Polyangium jinanense]|uniref:Polysaccharide export protein n=1 Tax=Polyangium jinanense TaxID=2829994 RepID=A0A9X3X631_9BACT|nr:polysaccharide biosynthesis/export family protein [Polyangium jinanense]MDC3959463.1 polysaccharide export protein [Polyangium jinanense]MDC3984897.1 polysaccharide export protein [Polyangium jinanense]